MKLILSRKGTDSSAGGFASPIFPDGSLWSVPIPDQRSPLKYRDLRSSEPVGKLVRNLSSERLGGTHRVHLDPDLIHHSIDRKTNWSPLFGQCGAAQSHLASHGVGIGDLFLFFGWFRMVELHRRRWRYTPGSPDVHLLYGWLQIGECLAVGDVKRKKSLEWASYHAHCHGDFSGNNVIYKAATSLQGFDCESAGAGIFGRFRHELMLSEAGCSRSNWLLPAWFDPTGRDSTLSYHSDPARWLKTRHGTRLKSANRGQEFVLNTDHYPEAFDWVSSLFTDC